MQKILIVDDEASLREVLEFNFSSAGFDTVTASSGEQALQAMAEGGVSLIVLDVMMGRMSGIDVAQQLREAGDHTPIIFLTALDTESDVLRGFRAGGDDYISKPFSIKELMARTQAVLARSATGGESLVLQTGQICLNTSTKLVTIEDEVLSLTKTEFSILLILMDKIGSVYSREELIRRVWGSEVYVEPRTVDVHIARLRKKLGSAASLIVNRSGYGYCIEC